MTRHRVTTHRVTRHRVVIGIGSNINPQAHVVQAQQRIAAQMKILKATPWQKTTPVGNPHQPDFLNGALLVETACDRATLKDRLKTVEQELGRTPDEGPAAPRTIDLDIVVWDGEIVDGDVYERDFLRDAVLELCPELGPQLWPKK